MKVHAHILVWNEEKILPFILDHYTKFCEKIFIWDNESTDSSREICEKYPSVEVITWSSNNTFNDIIHAQIKSTCYKKYSLDCDYVIVCDCDELLYDKNILLKLNQCKKDNIDMPNTVYYNMASKKYPIYNSQDITEIYQTGQRYGLGKNIIFNPKFDMKFGPGAHHCSYQGKTSLSKKHTFKILHYRYMSRDYMLDRHKILSKRLSDINLKYKFGVHYFQDHSNYMQNIIDFDHNVVNSKYKNVIFISDFSLKQVAHGGAEIEDDILCKFLGAEFINSSEIKKFDKNNLYIISNVSLMQQNILEEIVKHEYIILEHDCKFCSSRWFWQYQDNLVPHNLQTNRNVYENALVTILQSTDHYNVFVKNNIPGRFFNLECGLWAEDELKMFEGILQNNKTKINKHIIYNSKNWIKNTNGAIDYCKLKNIPYDLLENDNNRYDFLNKLAKYSHLVFFPIARETLCRFVVEARCLGVNVITKGDYGAVLEPWFKKYKEHDLINYLKEKTAFNLQKIKEMVEE